MFKISCRVLAYSALRDSVKRLTKEKDMIINKFLKSDYFYHKCIRDRNCSPLKVRRNGKNKLWKTDPSKFKIPVKRGLNEYGYITHQNYHEWSTDQ